MVKPKPLVWLHGEIRTPPFSAGARLEAGYLLRRLQNGEMLGLPHSRRMPSVDTACHELRIPDADHAWRILLYALEEDAVVILEIFSKKTPETPMPIVVTCRQRLRRFRSV